MQISGRVASFYAVLQRKMAARACVFLLTALAGASATRECLELTLSDKLIPDSLLNETILTIAAKNDSYETTSEKTNKIFELWDRFPKVLVPTNGSSEECRRDSRLFLDSLDRMELWALKMFDSTAKPSSGILSGNVQQYGDFDECLSINAAVQGKYCLAQLSITVSGNQVLDQVDFAIHSGHFLRSNMSDIGHRVPRYSSINWGICIPRTCSHKDLEQELSNRLSEFGFTVKVVDKMCVDSKSQRRPLSLGGVIAITFLSAIMLLLCLGTIQDDGSEDETNYKKLLNAFSLKRNWKKMFDISSEESKVKGIDMMRTFSALGLYIAHKSLALAHGAFFNKLQYSEMLQMPTAMVGRSAILYTDVFLYLSGFLTAYNVFKDLELKGKINIKDRYLARLFRLYPLLVSLILFCTYVLPDINNGPQWNGVVAEHSEVCKQFMWRSFLLIHNYFGFEDMCLTHTHQIGIDIQLFAVTIPLLLILWKFRIFGWVLFFLIAVGSSVLRYNAIYQYNISMIIYNGAPVQRLLDASRYSYSIPTHRATIYLIGVAMAYIIRNHKVTLSLSKSQVRVLYVSLATLCIYTMMYPAHMSGPDYKYEHRTNAIFATYSPITWGIFLSVLHWAICNGYGYTEWFIEAKIFKFFSKISYAFYLTQFPIFFYNVGIQRGPTFYTVTDLLYIPEFLVVIAISILVTLVVEMPFNNVYNKFFKDSPKKVKDK